MTNEVYRVGNKHPVNLTRYRVCVSGEPLDELAAAHAQITFDEHDDGEWVRYSDARIAELRMNNSDRVRAEHKKQIAAIEKHREELAAEYRGENLRLAQQRNECLAEIRRLRAREQELEVREVELRIQKRVCDTMKKNGDEFAQAARESIAYANVLTPRPITDETPDGVYVWVTDADGSDGEWTKAFRGVSGQWRGLCYFDPQPEFYIASLPNPAKHGTSES